MFSQAVVLGGISSPISFPVGPGAVGMSRGMGIKHNIVNSIFSTIVDDYKGTDLILIVNATQEAKVESSIPCFEPLYNNH